MNEDNPIVIALDYSRPGEIPEEIFDIFSTYHPKAKLNHSMSPEYWLPQAQIIKLNHGCDVLLDVKLHETPNTVAMACRNYARWPIWGITIHVSDPAMLKAAVETIKENNPDIKLFGVPLLSSVDRMDLAAGGVTVTSVNSLFVDRVNMAHECGLDGVVCAGENILSVTFTFEDLLTLVPGVVIEPTDNTQSGQKKTVTVRTAAKRGADYVVLGRSLTESENIALRYERAAAILAERIGR